MGEGVTVGVGVSVGGSAVSVGGTGVCVGGAGVSVGGSAVVVGDSAVSVGGAVVVAGSARVAVGSVVGVRSLMSEVLVVWATDSVVAGMGVSSGPPSVTTSNTSTISMAIRTMAIPATTQTMSDRSRVGAGGGLLPRGGAAGRGGMGTNCGRAEAARKADIRSAPLWKRCSGCLAIAFRTTASTAGGIFGLR